MILTAHIALFLVLGFSGRGDETIALRWEAPSHCPTRLQVLAQIDAELAGERSGSVIAAGKIVEENSALRLELEISAAQGHAVDTLRDPDCERLAEAAAIKIALTARDSSSSARDRTQELSPSTPGQDDELAPIAATQPPPQPVARRRTAELRVAAGVDWGTLPGVGAVFDAGVALIRWPRWRLEIAGVYLPARRFWWTTAPSRGGELTAAGGVVRGGIAMGRGSVRAQWDLAAEFTAVNARALDRTGRRRLAFRAAVWFTPSLVWAPGRLSAWLTPSLGVPLSRYRFVVEGPIAYQAPPVAVRCSIGLSVAL